MRQFSMVGVAWESIRYWPSLYKQKENIVKHIANSNELHSKLQYHPVPLRKNKKSKTLFVSYYFFLIITYKVIGFLDMRIYTTSYTDHPQELINIVTGVANKTCKERHKKKVPFLGGISQHTRQKLPPKTTSTYFTSKELRISQAAFSGEDMAVPTIAMCVCCSMYYCQKWQYD